jgi:hypothetical protein
MMRNRMKSLIAAAVMMLALTACSGSGGSTVSSATAAARPSSPAVLKILQPTNGEVVHGTTVELKVSLTGAKLVPATSATVIPTQGHLHVILDSTLVSMTSGLEQVVGGLTPGTHLLQVEFVASDHAPFNPRVTAAVSFKVKP